MIKYSSDVPLGIWNSHLEECLGITSLILVMVWSFKHVWDIEKKSANLWLHGSFNRAGLFFLLVCRHWYLRGHENLSEVIWLGIIIRSFMRMIKRRHDFNFLPVFEYILPFSCLKLCLVYACIFSLYMLKNIVYIKGIVHLIHPIYRYSWFFKDFSILTLVTTLQRSCWTPIDRWHFFGKDRNAVSSRTLANFLRYFILLINARKSCFQMWSDILLKTCY